MAPAVTHFHVCRELKSSIQTLVVFYRWIHLDLCVVKNPAVQIMRVSALDFVALKS